MSTIQKQLTELATKTASELLKIKEEHELLGVTLDVGIDNRVVDFDFSFKGTHSDSTTIVDLQDKDKDQTFPQELG